MSAVMTTEDLGLVGTTSELVLSEPRTIQRENPPRQKMVFRRLIMVFLVCSFIGWAWETLYCWITDGYLSCRQGFVIGPLSPIYGIGAVLMSVTVVPASKRSWTVTFLVGALTGGVVEFAGSYLQEAVMGTRSWDYTGELLSIGGRTNVGFMCAFGAMGCAYAKWLDPALRTVFYRVSGFHSKAACGLIIAVLALDVGMSIGAIERWDERGEGVPAVGTIDTYFDQHYDDDVMQIIYPTMDHVPHQ